MTFASLKTTWLLQKSRFGHCVRVQEVPMMEIFQHTFLFHTIKSSTRKKKKRICSVCVEDKRSFTDQVYDFSKPLILLVSDLNL